MAGNGWIGVDLDGTLAFYDRWQGNKVIGEPIAPMVTRVKKWLAQGQQVKVFTARAGDPDPEVIPAVQAWCLKNIGMALEVTNVKDYQLIELWDDRAVQVTKNMGIPITDFYHPPKAQT